MSSPSVLLIKTIAQFLSIYSILIFIRILLSWFPNVDWFSQPFAALSQITDPYLNLFRSFIPPIGGIDISAILAIILLQVAQDLVASIPVSAYTGY